MFNSFPVCRSICSNWIYEDPEYLKIWITMLSRARYLHEDKTGLYKGINYVVAYGEFIFGRPKWSMDLNIGEQKIRTCIKKLIADEMISIVKKYSKLTIFSVTNYAKYNQQLDQQQQQITESSNQQTTSTEPATNQQVTTTKKEKKEKNVIYTENFESFYKLYPNACNKEQTFTNYKNVLKTYKQEEIILATQNYIKTLKKKNTTKDYTTKSSNFVGQKQEYKEYLPKEEAKTTEHKPLTMKIVNL